MMGENLNSSTMREVHLS